MGVVKRGSSIARPMSDKAYLALHAAIVSCELAPGSWVKAAEVADFLGVGRTPTIQALLRLEAAGFTRPTKRKGWQVTEITLQSIHDILEAFRVVAPGMAELVVRNATDEQIAAFSALQDAWAPGQPPEEVPPDLAVHPVQHFVEICGNPVLIEMARGLAAHFERVMNFGLRQGTFVGGPYVKWRDVTLDALAARDEKRARAAILKLLDNGEVELSRILQNTQSIRSIAITIDRAS
jgi:DNA-binding GntR family transcriptional regulator